MENCEGCFLKQKDDQVCSYKMVDYQKICPCRECLIKSMCINSCETFSEVLANEFKY